MIIGFIAGIVVGAFVGVVLIALCMANGDDRENGGT